jgi:protein-disulfide isomerase
VNKITECANSEETKNEVNKEVLELEKTNIYGTPTIFINGKAFVGPKPYRVYRSAINKFIFF